LTENHSGSVQGKEPVDKEKINKTIREEIENAKSQVVGIKDTVKDKAKEYTENTKDYTDKAKDSGRILKVEATDKANDIKEVTNKAKEKVQDTKESVEEFTGINK
jgi:hypothetical protein